MSEPESDEAAESEDEGGLRHTLYSLTFLKDSEDGEELASFIGYDIPIPNEGQVIDLQSFTVPEEISELREEHDDEEDKEPELIHNLGLFEVSEVSTTYTRVDGEYNEEFEGNQAPLMLYRVYLKDTEEAEETEGEKEDE